MNRLPHGVWDDGWAGWEVASEDNGWRWIALPMGYNLRLVGLPPGPDGEWSWEYGWCFPKDIDAVMEAVAAWDPDTQDEPMGWHKRPGSTLRRAPRREAAPDYNRPRCEHGAYDPECRSVMCKHWRDNYGRRSAS